MKNFPRRHYIPQLSYYKYIYIHLLLNEKSLSDPFYSSFFLIFFIEFIYLFSNFCIFFMCWILFSLTSSSVSLSSESLDSKIFKFHIYVFLSFNIILFKSSRDWESSMYSLCYSRYFVFSWFFGFLYFWITGFIFCSLKIDISMYYFFIW